MADFKFLQMLGVIFCINIALVLGGVLHANDTSDDGNIITSFFSINSSGEVTGLDGGFQSKAEGVASSGAVTSGGFLGFTDLPNAFAGLFSFFFDSITAPFQLLFNPNLALPFQTRMMIGLPLTVLWIFGIIGYWRSGE